MKKVYERSSKNLFWSIKNSGEVLNKLKSRGFRATSLSTYDFSTLYTSLPHNLIKEKLINLIEWTFKREGSPYIACFFNNMCYFSIIVMSMFDKCFLYFRRRAWRPNTRRRERPMRTSGSCFVCPSYQRSISQRCSTPLQTSLHDVLTASSTT